MPCRPPLACIVLASWLTQGCTAPPRGQPLSAPPSMDTESGRKLQFAWPMPTAATVTDVVVKPGRSGKTRLRIRLTELGQQHRILLRFETVEVISLDGAAVSSSSAASPLLPGLVISQEGHPIEITDLAPLIARTVEVAGRGHPDAERSVRAQLDSPLGRESIRDGVRRYWRHWAGLWVDLPIPRPDEGPHHFDTTRSNGDGSSTRFHVRVESRASSAQEVELWQVQTMHPDDAEVLIRSGAAKTLASIAVPVSKPSVTDASVTVSAGGKFDAQTMQPRWIEVTTHIFARLDGIVTDTTDHHRYDFEWQPTPAK